jgi:hypothetical protein
VTESNGQVPAWLAALGIEPGEYFTGSKLKLKRGMKARCFSEAARIWCCLGLHTECFRQELAVKLVGNKRVPLQPVDVAAETGIKKQNIRRGMLQLRAWGLGEIEGEEHHEVKLYGWCNPRPVIPEEVISRDYLGLEPVPEQWRTLFRRFKVRPAAGFEFARDYLDEIECAARDYQKAAEVLKSVLGRSRAGDPIQRKERNSETNNNSEGIGTSEGVDAVAVGSALERLIARGVAAKKARLLLAHTDEQHVQDQIDYAEHLIQQDRRGRGKISNPAGFVIWAIESNLSVPADFETGTRRCQRIAAEEAANDRRFQLIQAHSDYAAYVERSIDERIAALEPATFEAETRQQLKAVRAEQPEWFARVPDATRREVAMSRVRAGIREDLQIPSFDEWLDRERATGAGGDGSVRSTATSSSK